MNDKNTTIQKLKNLTEKFTKDRDWTKYYSSRNLAISIAIEAAELMEHFQWHDCEKDDKKELENELADIIVYCCHFAVHNKIDISQAVKKKLAITSKKYPVKLFNIKNILDLEDYWEIKKKHRNKE